MANQIDEDEPLDPVMEKVRVKMVRLLGISIGLMLLALITVLGAVVYKISQGSETSQEEAENISASGEQASQSKLLENIKLGLPQGARVVSSSLSTDRLLLDLRMNDGNRQFWVVDLVTGNIISRVEVQ